MGRRSSPPGAADGPQEAVSFEAFVAGRSTALLRTAYLLTGDRARALDLLWTALAAASRRWDRMADAEEATAVVRRELVAAHTGWWNRLWLGDLLADSRLLAGTAGLPGFVPPPADAGPDDGVAAALDRLPPRTRAALVLRLGEGRSEDATAAELGARVEEVRAWTRRGLDRLRELLDATGAGDEALTGRLRRSLAVRSAGAPDPEITAAQVLAAVRGRRRHLAGLAALAGFVVLVLVLVAVTASL